MNWVSKLKCNDCQIGKSCEPLLRAICSLVTVLLSDRIVSPSWRGWKKLPHLSAPIWVWSRQHASESRSNSLRRLLELSDCYAHWMSLYGVLVWAWCPHAYACCSKQPGKTSQMKVSRGGLLLITCSTIRHQPSTIAGCQAVCSCLHFSHGHPASTPNWWRMPSPAPNHVSLSQSCQMIRPEKEASVPLKRVPDTSSGETTESSLETTHPTENAFADQAN